MVKQILITLVICTAMYLAVPSNLLAQPYGYEGTQVCSMCHKTEKQGQQLKIWQESKHANAFKALQTPEADKIAADKGLKTKAAESKECLKCHASGYEEGAVVGAKFKKDDGVQCETCHGAGSAYKTMSVMKNKAEAKAKGLADLSDINATCVKCHNSESPTFKEFKFDEMWAKIAHKVPKG